MRGLLPGGQRIAAPTAWMRKRRLVRGKGRGLQGPRVSDGTRTRDRLDHNPSDGGQVGSGFAWLRKTPLRSHRLVSLKLMPQLMPRLMEARGRSVECRGEDQGATRIMCARTASDTRAAGSGVCGDARRILRQSRSAPRIAEDALPDRGPSQRTGVDETFDQPPPRRGISHELLKLLKPRSDKPHGIAQRF